MPHWTAMLGVDRVTLNQSARTAVATVASALLASLLKMPEFYWAPISTIVILLSTINPFTLAWQRFVGTALGAVLGVLIASALRPESSAFLWIIYGLGIFVCGILSAFLRIGTAYRFAAITMTIVLLVTHSTRPWIVATHRFIEVSLGIAVALAITAIWRVPDVTSS
jgi:uncharacterized membrane protein YccC